MVYALLLLVWRSVSGFICRYNNKTYRVDDIDWDTKPTNKFKLSRGEEISYNEYYFKVRVKYNSRHLQGV